MIKWFDCDRGLFSIRDEEQLETAEYMYNNMIAQDGVAKIYILMMWADTNNIPYTITTNKRLSLVVDNTKK